MGATSEERQEIAKLMRESVRAEDYLDEAIVGAIYKVMGKTRIPVGFIVMDLIDPTTHIECDEHGYEYCARCGYNDWNLSEDARFCPNCGARIVDKTVVISW